MGVCLHVCRGECACVYECAGTSVHLWVCACKCVGMHVHLLDLYLQV